MAGRYATALFELALEANAVDAVASDLNKFDAMVAESADLARLVKSPVFTADDQARAVTALLDKAGIGGLAAKFVKLVVSNRRLFAIHDIVRAFKAMVAKHKGEVTAQVTAAEKLSDARLNEIKSSLKSATGKDVQVDVKIDPAIIGGLIVKLGSRMIDSSLRTKLNAIKFAMKEAR
jgi:F-type H+-transporting ATPase subunit delta